MNRPLSRAEFLRLIGLGFAVSTTGGVPPAWAQSTTDRRRRISELIEAYDGEGVHRTATIVDNESAVWLRQLATMAGAEVRSRLP